jgi:hypothetical protein
VVASAVVELAYLTPYWVKAVAEPLPPFATAKGPAEEEITPAALFNITPAVVKAVKLGVVEKVLSAEIV